MSAPAAGRTRARGSLSFFCDREAPRRNYGKCEMNARRVARIGRRNRATYLTVISFSTLLRRDHIICRVIKINKINKKKKTLNNVCIYCKAILSSLTNV